MNTCRITIEVHNNVDFEAVMEVAKRFHPTIEEFEDPLRMNEPMPPETARLIMDYQDSNPNCDSLEVQQMLGLNNGSQMIEQVMERTHPACEPVIYERPFKTNGYNSLAMRLAYTADPNMKRTTLGMLFGCSHTQAYYILLGNADKHIARLPDIFQSSVRKIGTGDIR